MKNYNPNKVFLHGGWLGDFFFIWGEQKQHKKYKDYLNFQYPFLYSPFELKLTLFQEDPLSFYGTFVEIEKATLIAPIEERIFYSEVDSSHVYQADPMSTEFKFPLEGLIIAKKEIPQYLEQMKTWEFRPNVTFAYDFSFWLSTFTALASEITNGNVVLTPSGSWEIAKFPWESWTKACPPASFSLMKQGVQHRQRENLSFKKVANEVCSHFIHHLISNHDDVKEAYTNLYHKKEYLFNDTNNEVMNEKLFWEELGVIATVPFQTAIAIEEPTLEEKDWTVFLFVQDREDPSVMVSIEQLHGGDHPWRMNPIIRLKEDISAIISLIPELADLSITHPSAFVSKETVYEILTHHFQQFMRLGINVVVPNWLKKRPKPFQATISVTDQRVSDPVTSESMFNWQKLSEFNYEIYLDGEKFTYEQFTQLVNKKTPFIKWNDKWLYWDSSEANRLHQYLNKKNEQPASLLDVWKMYLLQNEKVDDEDFISIEWDDKLKSAIDATLQKTIPAASPPSSLVGELRAYQLEGMSWLLHMRKTGFGACLADDMGLGKSIQAIAYMLAVLENQKRERTVPFLIICPTSLIGNWQEEIQRFAPHLSVLIHHGNDRLTKETNEVNYDIIITSYTLAFRDQEIFSTIRWNALILDEAQQIKNVETKQRKAIKEFQAAHIVALTGTPIENRLKELWSIMDMLNNQYLGKFQQFQQAFVKEIEGNQLNSKKIKQLQLLISPFLLRRKKSDKALELQLPDKTEQTYIVGLTAEQASLYQAVVNELITTIDEKTDIERRATILSSITKLKQICNHPAQFLKDRRQLHNRSEKWDLCFTLVEQIIDQEDKLLIFTQYKEMGSLLQQGLSDHFHFDVPFLHGGLNRQEREQLITTFKTDQNTPIFILSLRAGGVGLNLTAANHVIHYDRWWNPAVENQATDRAYRIGQTEKVTVHKLVSKGTIEEKIDQLLEKKQLLSDDILAVNENRFSELTKEELQSLLEWSDQPS